MDPWLERIWVGSEAKEEGRGLNTGAYCSLTLAMISRKTTSGEESTDGVKCKRKIRIWLRPKERGAQPACGGLTKLRGNAWYVE